MIICGCFLRVAGKLSVLSAERKFGAIVQMKLRRAYWRLRRAGAFTFCTSFKSRCRCRQPRSGAQRNLPALLLRNSFARHSSICRSEVSTGSTRPAKFTNFAGLVEPVETSLLQIEE